MLSRVTAKNVGDVSLRHSVVVVRRVRLVLRWVILKLVLEIHLGLRE